MLFIPYSYFWIISYPKKALLVLPLIYIYTKYTGKSLSTIWRLIYIYVYIISATNDTMIPSIWNHLKMEWHDHGNHPYEHGVMLEFHGLEKGKMYSKRQCKVSWHTGETRHAKSIGCSVGYSEPICFRILQNVLCTCLVHLHLHLDLLSC